MPCEAQTRETEQHHRPRRRLGGAERGWLIEAHIALRQRGAEILAIYHSHPRWEAVPSKTDLAENHYGRLPRIIISLCGNSPEVRVWELEPDSFSELTWRIVEQEACRDDR